MMSPHLQNALVLPHGGLAYTTPRTSSASPTDVAINFTAPSASEQGFGYEPAQHVRYWIGRTEARALAEFFTGVAEMLRPDPTKGAPAQVKVAEPPSRERRVLEALRWACGHVEDGSSQRFSLSQDDATKHWVVGAGTRRWYGASFEEALDLLVNARGLEVGT